MTSVKLPDYHLLRKYRIKNLRRRYRVLRGNFYERKQERKAHLDKNVYGWKLRNCSACSGSKYYDWDNVKCGACSGTGEERYKPSEDEVDGESGN